MSQQEREYLIECLSCNRKFNDYAHQAVFWSADTIPVCPYCYTSVYDGDFREVEGK